MEGNEGTARQETHLGWVTRHFSRLHCIGIRIDSAALAPDHRVRFVHDGSAGKDPVDFDQPVLSIEVNREPVELVEPGVTCGFKIDPTKPLPTRGAEVLILN